MEPARPSTHTRAAGLGVQGKDKAAVPVLGEAVSPRPSAEANGKGNTEDSCPTKALQSQVTPRSQDPALGGGEGARAGSGRAGARRCAEPLLI